MTIATSSSALANGSGMASRATADELVERTVSGEGTGGSGTAAALGHGARILGAMEPVPPPDRAAEPDGFVVVVEPGDRIHFLDWGGGAGPAMPAGVLLIHGLSNTAWSWTPVARRLRAARHVVAMDLRGHGLSDAPTEGYDAGDLRRRRPRGRRGLGAARDGGRSGRPRRPRVRGDRRGLGRRRDGRALCRARARRRRLGVDRGRQRDGRRRVPARSRRAARGHALDDGVPRRPRGLRPGDVGRRPGAGRAGHGRRDPRRQGRAVDAAARPRGERPGDVPLRPADDARGRDGAGRGAGRRVDETGSRAAALAAASAARAAPGGAGSRRRRSTASGTT